MALHALHADVTVELPTDADAAMIAVARRVPELRGLLDAVLAAPPSAAGLRAILFGFDAARHLRIACDRPLVGPGVDASNAFAPLYEDRTLEQALLAYARAVAGASAARVVDDLIEQGAVLDDAGRSVLRDLDAALAQVAVALDGASAAGDARGVLTRLALGLGLVGRRRAHVGTPAPIAVEDRAAAQAVIARLAERIGPGASPGGEDLEILGLDDALAVFARRSEAVLGISLDVLWSGPRARSLRVAVAGHVAGRIYLQLAPAGARDRRSEITAHSRGTVVIRTRFDGGLTGDRLTLPHVLSLFHELGHAVHHLCDDHPAPNLAGLGATPPLRREIPSFLGESLALDDAGSEALTRAGARSLAIARRRLQTQLTAYVRRACVVALSELAIDEAGDVAPAALVTTVDRVCRATPLGVGLGDFVELADAGMLAGTGTASYVIGRIAGAQLAHELPRLGAADARQALFAITRGSTDLRRLDPAALCALYGDLP